MPKNRDKFKRASQVAKKERALDSITVFGIKDPTPKEAVARIICTQKQAAHV